MTASRGDETIRDALARLGAGAPADLWGLAVRGLGDDVLSLPVRACAPALSGALVRSLGEVRRGGCAARTEALPLLAVDAQVTHAFELWAESEPERLAARAAELLRALTAGGVPS